VDPCAVAAISSRLAFGPRLISPSNDPAANSSPEPIQFVQELHKAMAGIETLQK